jgi:Flp pilus assembly protein TadG
MVWRIWKDQEGSALLEGAIVVPVLFSLIFGTLEFSFYFFQQHLVATGVRDAARYLARTDPADAAARVIAQNLAATGYPAGGSMRRVRGFNPADVTISFTDRANVVGVTGVRPYREAAEECGGPNSVRTINVTGSYAYTPFAMIPGITFSRVTVIHRERCIGPG